MEGALRIMPELSKHEHVCKPSWNLAKWLILLGAAGPQDTRCTEAVLMNGSGGIGLTVKA